MRGFPLSAKSSRSIIMAYIFIFLTVNLHPRFHKGADSFLVFFSSFFSEEKKGESWGQTHDKFSVSYPEVLETSPKALRKQKEGKCSRENSVW